MGCLNPITFREELGKLIRKSRNNSHHSFIPQIFIQPFSSGAPVGIRDTTLNRIGGYSYVHGVYLLLRRQIIKK